MSFEIDLLDFEDSFTWNIYCELKILGLSVQVIPLASMKSHLASLLQDTSDLKKILILGPGPGHPREYEFLYDDLLKLLDFKNYFFMGICLGHQILWRLKGIQTVRHELPVHGQGRKLIIPHWDFFPPAVRGKEVQVQKYNSLKLNHFDFTKKHMAQHLFVGDESFMGQFERGITYQFHPESVGTSYRRGFFLGLLKFLYNSYDDEKPNAHRRYLPSGHY